jgi:hypothetical protein
MKYASCYRITQLIGLQMFRVEKLHSFLFWSWWRETSTKMRYTNAEAVLKEMRWLEDQDRKKAFLDADEWVEVPVGSGNTGRTTGDDGGA